MDDSDRRYFPVDVETKLPVEIARVLRSWKDKPKGNYMNGEGFGPLHQYLLDVRLGDFDPTGSAPTPWTARRRFVPAGRI